MVQVFAHKLQGINRAPLEAAITPVLRAHGVETAEISHQKEPVGWVLRVIVESVAPSVPSPAASHADSEASVDTASEPLSAPVPVTAAATSPEGAPVTAAATSPEGAPGGVGLGLLTEISRDLSSALDVADVIPHRYTLEVSSPGLDRPLRTRRDYDRAVGEIVKVHLGRPAPDGQRVLRGRLVQVEDESITIEVDGKRSVAEWSAIERAHTIYELPAQPKRKKPTKNQRH